MRDDEVTGVDPSVFRRYFREEGLEELKDSEAEENNDVNLAGGGGYNRAEVRDYKMPRRKTTKRRKARKVPETDRWLFVRQRQPRNFLKYFYKNINFYNKPHSVGPQSTVWSILDINDVGVWWQNHCMVEMKEDNHFVINYWWRDTTHPRPIRNLPNCLAGLVIFCLNL